MGDCNIVGRVKDIEGVSLETPWTSSLTNSRRRSIQHMGDNEEIHAREHRDNNNERSLKGWEKTHSAGSSRVTGRMNSRHSGGVGKHGMIASPIAEKPPWH